MVLTNDLNQRTFNVSPVHKLVPGGIGLKNSLDAMLKEISDVDLSFSRLSTLSEAIEYAV